MPIHEGMMSSDSGEWETPQQFFDALDACFHFRLDAAASKANAKCANYYTREVDGLAQPWWSSVWCNPPYGREIGRWVEKGYRESLANYNDVVVMLVPARTDTNWWHDWAMKADEIYLIRGRLRFVGGPSSAPFPSAVLVFGGDARAGSGEPQFRTMNAKGIG